MMSQSLRNFTWPSNPFEDFICNLDNCYEKAMNATGQYYECCDGHYESSQLLDFVNQQRHRQIGATNREVLDSTNPTSLNYNMPYIYEHMNWDHCDEDFYKTFEKYYLEANEQ
jgi:hypothetical protein